MTTSHIELVLPELEAEVVGEALELYLRMPGRILLLFDRGDKADQDTNSREYL